jgi:hypothetical protein
MTHNSATLHHTAASTIELFLPGLAWELGLFAVQGSAPGGYVTFQQKRTGLT